MEQYLLIAAAAVAGVFVVALSLMGTLRWVSFNSRVDRRRQRRRQFEESWSDMIRAAEQRAQAAKAQRESEQQR